MVDEKELPLEETVAEEAQELTPEEAKERLDELQRICTVYLDCPVTDFIAKALYRKEEHRLNELKFQLMTVLSYFNNYHMQIQALMKTPLKLVTEFESTEAFNAYFKEESVMRQKHFENLMDIRANQAIITQRIGFISFVDETYTGRPVDLPNKGKQAVDNN